MAGFIPETIQKIFTAEALRSAAKQSEGCLVVPVRLRRAIKKYLREQEEPHMKRKVLRLSESFNEIKEVNLMLTESTSKELFEDPLKSMEQSKRWKIKSAYGDVGLKVLTEVRRRLPGFSPAKVLDFGAGTGSAFWALREVWPRSLEKVNLVEPSQSMQRAGQSLIQGLKDLPLIHSYTSIQALTKHISKSEREHDLVIASYVLGEIPSLKDRITIVRQLWDLTQGCSGTPQGSSIISQMRSHILWMEKRKSRKSENHKSKDAKKETSKDLVNLRSGVHIVAPCPHDGRCPLENSGKYCHFAQRLQRTTTQRAYKHSKGESLRGFEDEKFSFVAFRRGQRPREPWPLDGIKFETLKEQHANRNPEDLEIDYEDLMKQSEAELVPYEKNNKVYYESDANEHDVDDGNEDWERKEEETSHADLGGGWGRIIFSPVRRGRQVAMDVCRSIKSDGSEGSFQHLVFTRSKNPTLHRLARKSLWGDLWPF
ncbi:methyltransferase-like protein 17, mitochondrial [Melia azedarach]|uniref:Methyltransferase-like protein 17, mitochondrial n=1 Tax=Melia azedarach TaxID=155640 RepID=A0ACC1XK97_MELAZ|nr:methyltransferase-like protein 17, mitochondrial [Melia azedarach]